ncbi:MAG: hypothetical protein FJ149_06330 [Euryarchaeota archaeon]|nr:hypothetical protein [Euryarchaeota archaeon]
MEAAERDALIIYIEVLERWEAQLGRAGPPPVADELDWMVDVLDDEITSWIDVLLNEPTLSSRERSDLLKTVNYFERWKA